VCWSFIPRNVLQAFSENSKEMQKQACSSALLQETLWSLVASVMEGFKPTSTTTASIVRVRKADIRSPRKPRSQACWECNLLQRSLWPVLLERLAFRHYGLQIFHHETLNDNVISFEFCANLTARIASDIILPSQNSSIYEAKFHPCEKINRCNFCVRGKWNPHAVFEHVRETQR
jgi:hypothetical protein